MSFVSNYLIYYLSPIFGGVFFLVGLIVDSLFERFYFFRVGFFFWLVQDFVFIPL